MLCCFVLYLNNNLTTIVKPASLSLFNAHPNEPKEKRKLKCNPNKDYIKIYSITLLGPYTDCDFKFERD